VPGIHAQPSFGGAAPLRPQPATTPWLWLGSGALAVALVAVIAWYLMSPSPVAVGATPAVSAPPPIAAAPAVVMPAPAAVPPVQAVVPKPEVALVARKSRPMPASEPVAATGDAKPAAASEKIYTLAELPDDIRRQLPAINVGGSMYSSKPADRVLIINGQVLHEGDRIAPDLLLLQIRLKGALLSFKDYRYTVAF
jgi:general secretion pathway protein B